MSKEKPVTKEEAAYIKANSHKIPIKRLAEALGWSATRLIRFQKLNDCYPTDAQREAFNKMTFFQKGSIPHNKGKRLSAETLSKISRTWFKKGQKPVNYAPVGEIRFHSKEYWYIKVEDPDQWELLHRYVWRIFHGEIPKGMAVIFKDGNRNNLNIDNLEMVSRRELAHMNRDKFYAMPEDYKKVKFTLRSISRKVNELAKKII